MELIVTDSPAFIVITSSLSIDIELTMADGVTAVTVNVKLSIVLLCVEVTVYVVTPSDVNYIVLVLLVKESSDHVAF